MRRLLSFVLVVVLALIGHAIAEGKPNVIFFIADDLGYADLGCQGRDNGVRTPNIDALAADGVRFTNAYATANVCAPSRAAIVSGRYQQRYGFEFDVNVPPATFAAQTFGLPRDEATLAERLKPLGYATALIGKWHLGFAETMLPTARGYDLFFGFRSGWHTYLPGGRNVDAIWRNGVRVDEREYLTDAFARESCAFIKKESGRPFYLHLAFNAVHFPMLATPQLEERCLHISDPKRRTYAAMVLSMDDAVGRVMAAMSERGEEENTLIVFVNDHGGSPQQNRADNSPLRGAKMQMYEGGIRVPMIMRWKGHLPEGKVYEPLVSTLDIHATVLAACGIAALADKPLDGVDLVPFVTGKLEGVPHDALFWRDSTSGSAVRKGDWKLVQPKGGDAQLYHLTDDISESHDLASKEPKKLHELVAAWTAWNAEMKKSEGK